MTCKNSKASGIDTTRQFSTCLLDYIDLNNDTGMLPQKDLLPVLNGLFREVGSVMTTSKKLYREGKAYAGYRHAVVEELGDVLWYFTALCKRLEF